MASVELSSKVIIKPAVYASAKAAGLSVNMISRNIVDVYSDDAEKVAEWAKTQTDLSQNTYPIKMAPRLIGTAPTRMNPATSTRVNPAAAGRSWFKMNEIAAIYGIPAPVSSTKVVVGVVSFGGGLYGTIDANGVLTGGDCQAYWTSIGIAPANHPRVIVKPILGAINSPNVNDGGSTYENTLDVEVIGGACPSPNLTIILYIAPNTLNSFPALLNYMYSTPVVVNSVSYKPTIISCSWGAPEIYYGTTLLNNINSIFASMTSSGMNICVATGDNGSNDGVGGSANYVDFPSSSPNVTAVGGTRLVCANNTYDARTVEQAWSSGGGGISGVFAKPAYQTALSAIRRSTPDIAADADPNTGVVFTVNASNLVFGGTSVSAPIIAAFLAAVNCTTFVNPLLYGAPTTCFHDIASGSNGSFNSRSGYDNCTGLGSIIGVNLSNSLKNIVRVSGVAITLATTSLLKGSSYQATAVIVPVNASDKSVTWASSNTAVATVSSTGLITAVKVGTANITATTHDGSKVGTKSVSVYQSSRASIMTSGNTKYSLYGTAASVGRSRPRSL